MHNLVWLAVSISVGLFFSYLSGGIFSADYSSIWSAVGAIGTLGAWYFLYQQSKASNEQMRLASEQLKAAQLSTYRAEIRHSIDRTVEYLMNGESVRYDRLSWINASVEIENISALVALLPQELQASDTERFGRLLDSKIPEDLFEHPDGRSGSSLLTKKMLEIHKKGKGRFEECDRDFPGKSYLLAVYMFTREYTFSSSNFKPRRNSFFYVNDGDPLFECYGCSNKVNR